MLSPFNRKSLLGCYNLMQKKFFNLKKIEKQITETSSRDPSALIRVFVERTPSD
jgi:hypothetical protein